MSYQVLARKWRPSNFSQVAGQSHVLKSLINALDNQRLHHAYLFTGTRGVGKTTLARILAKCLNCEKGISSKPCETCDSCREISEGRFIDLIEVDAASRTKVEDTRELLDNVQYAPSIGRFKVYLIDEVHMLSTHSFNALLKTLEEPPPHVKFLFATTDPQKLPITVLSRCLQFNLKNLSPQQITEYLMTVLKQEEIEFAEEALWQIAAAANGSMRDALTLVDQAVSYCEGRITVAGIVEMLGIPEQQKVYALLDKMSSGNINDVFRLVQELAEHTPDYVHTVDGLLAALHRVALAQVIPDAIDNSLGDKKQLQTLATALTAEDVQLYYQMGIKGRDDLRLSVDSRAAFEMLLLRMMVFSPNYVPVARASGAATATPDGQSGEKKKETSVTNIAAERAAPHGEPVVKAEPKPTPEHKTEPESKPTPEHKTEPESKPKQGQGSSLPNQPLPEPVPKQVPVKQQKLSDELTNKDWLLLYNEINASGIAGNVLANSELIEVKGSTFEFVLDESQSAVFSDEIVPKLEQALSVYFNTEITIRICSGDVNNETPAMRSQRLKQERHLAMVNEFEHDENVQELVKHFSGTIAKDSIAPLSD